MIPPIIPKSPPGVNDKYPQKPSGRNPKFKEEKGQRRADALDFPVENGV